jgi:hypothetical protein
MINVDIKKLDAITSPIISMSTGGGGAGYAPAPPTILGGTIN